MKNIIIKPGSFWRELLPLVQKLRGWAWKFHDRTAQRLVISGGKVQFMDAELEFPEDVGLTYAAPLFWNGPHAYDFATDRVLTALIGQSKLFLDVGSNIGLYSVYAGVKFPQVKTVAFEPVPVIWKKNCAFHRANNLSEKIVHNLALSDRDGEQKIFLSITQISSCRHISSFVFRKRSGFPVKQLNDNKHYIKKKRFVCVVSHGLKTKKCVIAHRAQNTKIVGEDK